MNGNDQLNLNNLSVETSLVIPRAEHKGYTVQSRVDWKVVKPSLCELGVFNGGEIEHWWSNPPVILYVCVPLHSFLQSTVIYESCICNH